mmetsp:Transcript_20936/g.58801  ORF Transcript_20936/g.58801 Transcript_20936/m.58801 type:complete len:257 (+) Transcript_20936:439-1209(+)
MRIVRQLRARKEVRERNHCAWVGLLQEPPVQVQHVPPDVVVLVHRPPGELVELVEARGPGIPLVEVGVVPREERDDEDAVAHGRREDVHLELVAERQDPEELGDRVRQLLLLDRVDPQVVVAGREEDAAELVAQEPQALPQLDEALAHVSCDDEHVFLELCVADPGHPLVGAGVVEVDVRDREDARALPRPPPVPPEAGEARPARRVPPQRRLRDARLPSQFCWVVCRHAIREQQLSSSEVRVGLLEPPHAKERRA